MFRNYFKTAIRNFRKNPFYTLINVMGLVMGIVSTLLIVLYVLYESGYDRYNLKASRTFRINNEIKFGNNYYDLAQAPAPMGPTIAREFPDVEHYLRLRFHGPILIRKGAENFREAEVMLADSTLLDVFSFQVLSGDASRTLREPNSLVITEKIARKYFNRTDVAGQDLLVNNTTSYRISAVIRDMPVQSHFRADIFVPMLEHKDSREGDWISQNYNTYIVFKPGADIKKLDAAFNLLLNRETAPLVQSTLNISMADFNKQGGFVRSNLIPVTAIHLYSHRTGELRANGSVQYIYIFSAVALFILIIACVNFMNLVTARSANRAREIGIRKVLGSFRKDLIIQFLTESVLLSLFALLMALLATYLLLPGFNRLAGTEISTDILFQPAILGLYVLLIPAVGLLAGSYPAFFLSAFQPIQVLKGRIARGFRNSWIRDGLVTFQFTISLILIIGTIVIYSQLRYIRHKDIGYNRSQVMVLENTGVLGSQGKSFKNELMQINGISKVTMSAYFPVKGHRNNDAFFPSPVFNQKEVSLMQLWEVDEDYIPALNISLIAGRNFVPGRATDSSGIIINEAAANFLGRNGQLDKKLYRPDNGSIEELHIIGVIRNFNFSSLRDMVTPLALRLHNKPDGLAIRISASGVPQTIENIRKQWKTYVPGEPFDYHFMDEDFNEQYKADEKTAQTFITLATCAIIIACMGLLGLVSYAAEQRSREIGIRKVLGASTPSIFRLLSTNFLKLVFIAILLSVPVSWWMMSKWLQEFAYRTELNGWIFIAAGLMAMIIALATISFQAIKAAIANPIESLRSE
jgi:putative ABC transport system permease protein